MGGTGEARNLSFLIKKANLKAVISYSGAVSKTNKQPLPKRTGGFGGANGLAKYIIEEKITHLVDATHPFANQISENAILAAKETQVHFVALERDAWKPKRVDQWTKVKDIEDAIQLLDGPRERIFLAIGRHEVKKFETKKHHFYLLRIIENTPVNFDTPSFEIIYDKGPFKYKNDKMLLLKYNITKIITKNSGGLGAKAKLDVARDLNIPIIMIDRPIISPRYILNSPDKVFNWIIHSTDLGV